LGGEGQPRERSFVEEPGIVGPLGIEGCLGKSAHALVIFGGCTEEGPPHRGIGQVDLEGGGALEMTRILVNPTNAADQEGGLQIF
jgi:hypothetical protein